MSFYTIWCRFFKWWLCHILINTKQILISSSREQMSVDVFPFCTMEPDMLLRPGLSRTRVKFTLTHP